MRQSDQTSPGFYASSGPHPALELEMNDEADCSVHTSGDKDVSFSSFRRRQEAPSLTQSPPPQLGGQERETVQGRVMGRRSTGYGRRSTGGDSTDLPPYSIRDPLRSPTVPGGPLRERGVSLPPCLSAHLPPVNLYFDGISWSFLTGAFSYCYLNRC